MSVVGNHGGAAVGEQVETALRVVTVIGEVAQSFADGGPVLTQCPGSCHTGHHVLDLETNGAAQSDGHIGKRDGLQHVPLGCNHMAAFHKHHGVALGAVCGHDRMVLVCREKGHRTFAFDRHGCHYGVGGIEHGGTGAGHVLHDHALEYGQLIHCGDVVQAQVVAAADVGYHGYVTAVKGQTFAQHTTPCGFQYCCIDIRVQQHTAGAFGSAAVTGVDGVAIDIDAVGIGHAHTQTALGQQVGNQAYRGGFAIGTRHRHDGNASVLPLFEHAGDDGFAHCAALAKRWREVHAQAGCRVHFHHTAALVFQGLQDAVAHHVHTTNVQADHVRCGNGARGHFRVHIVGHIGGGSTR